MTSRAHPMIMNSEIAMPCFGASLRFSGANQIASGIPSMRIQPIRLRHPKCDSAPVSAPGAGSRRTTVDSAIVETLNSVEQVRELFASFFHHRRTGHVDRRELVTPVERTARVNNCAGISEVAGG